MKEYYFETLDEKQQNLYRRFLDALKNGKLTYRADYPITAKQAHAVHTAVRKDHPELYYINLNQVSACGTEISVEYYFTDCEKRKAKFNANFMHAIATIGDRRGQSDEALCRKIHDYLLRNVVYDYAVSETHDESNTSAFTAYGAIVEGKAVCAGISAAFKMLCNFYGIECLTVHGECPINGKYERHAWNMVKIGDRFAHVDVTWDLNLTASDGFIRYDYYLLNQNEMHYARKYEAPITADDCTDINWFAQNSCLLNSVHDLDTFVVKCVKEKKKVIYFKLIHSPYTDDEELKEIAEKVNSIVLKHIHCGCTCTNNSDLLVFCYKMP